MGEAGRVSLALLHWPWWREKGGTSSAAVRSRRRRITEYGGELARFRILKDVQNVFSSCLAVGLLAAREYPAKIFAGLL